MLLMLLLLLLFLSLLRLFSIPGITHTYALKAGQGLANACRDVGKLSEAQEYYEKALSPVNGFEAQLGKEHPWVLINVILLSY